MKVALTIAGSDTCGGAGLQADLRVFQALGVYGASVATALTAQNTQGVRRVHHVPPRFVAEQIDAVTRDLPIAAAKVGMLGRAQVVAVVAERVRRRQIPNLVVDPVTLAKDGTPLLSARGVAVLKRELLPTSLLVTPNVPEAEALSGRTIESDAGVEEAARVIAGFGVAGVLIKGGHLLGPPDDTLFWDGQITRFPAERIETPRPVHGTGCLYSAAIAAYLARGAAVPAACESAKRFVEQAIRTALALGRGSLICPLGGEEPSGARVVR